MMFQSYIFQKALEVLGGKNINSSFVGAGRERAAEQRSRGAWSVWKSKKTAEHSISYNVTLNEGFESNTWCPLFN